MGSKNNINVPDFDLLGLTESEDIPQFLFILFLLIYLITVLGNADMILIICLDLQLHTPMYFFLSHLLFLDLSYSTVITPKTLENLLTSIKHISFMGCFNRFFFFIFLVITEIFFLSSMAYDRYVAICNPLHYQVVMSRQLCYTLITVSYMIGFTQSLALVLCISSLHFYKSKVICHFFCDTTPVLALSCNDTHDTEILAMSLVGLNLVGSLIIITVSYVSILFNILKINSTSGKHKAFTTCDSHLLGVAIFYGTTIFTYLKPKKSYTLGRDQVAFVFYTIMIPMLNPFMSWNKEVKNALLRIIQNERAPGNFNDRDVEHLSALFLSFLLGVYF